MEIAKERIIETIYAIMMSDNSKALVITKKMGFKLEHLNNGLVKGILNIKEETFDQK